MRLVDPISNPNEKRFATSGTSDLGRSGEMASAVTGQTPAYITWECYETNVERLRENRATWEVKGAARNGPALLGGLILCAQCGARLNHFIPGPKWPRVLLLQSPRV